MKVILKQDIKGVGKKDQVINAADGYARNFLLPRGLAVSADTKNMNTLKAKSDANSARKQRDFEDSKKLAEQLKTKELNIFVKVGNNGKLFGGVTSKEISDALKEQLKVEVDKKKVLLNEVIKQEGTFIVDLKLQEGVIAKIKVNVKAQK